MKFVCLQDERAGNRRDVFEVIHECTRLENERVERERKANELHPFRFSKVVVEANEQFKRAVQEAILVHEPHYFVTVNFNFPNDAIRQKQQKYRNQRPRPDSLKNLDAVLNNRIVKRRANRLPAEERISMLSFDEYTTTENLHCHLLLWIPDRTRFSKMGLSKQQIDSKIQSIIREVLEHFFPRASVDIQAIYDPEGAVTYATKCVSRSSEIDWTYWRKPLTTHDAVRLNTEEHPSGNTHGDTDTSNSRPRHNLEGCTRVPTITGVAQSTAEVGRRQIVTDDNKTSTITSVDHSRTSHSTGRIHLGSNPHRTVIVRILAFVRQWFRMPIADG